MRRPLALELRLLKEPAEVGGRPFDANWPYSPQLGAILFPRDGERGYPHRGRDKQPMNTAGGIEQNNPGIGAVTEISRTEEI